MFGDRVEEKRQELLAVAATGTREDIRHVLLGTSSDTTAKIIPYLSDAERFITNEIMPKVYRNPNIKEGDESRLFTDLQIYFAESTLHKRDINSARDNLGKAQILAALFMAYVTGQSFVGSAKTKNEIAVLETSPDLYIQSRPHILADISDQCEKGHPESETKRIHREVERLMEGYRADPTKEKTLTINVNPQTEGDLRHCVQGSLTGTHRDKLQNLQEEQKVVSSVFLAATLGLGLAGGRRIRNSRRKQVKAEVNLAALRADPFLKPLEGLTAD